MDPSSSSSSSGYQKGEGGGGAEEEEENFALGLHLVEGLDNDNPTSTPTYGHCRVDSVDLKCSDGKVVKCSKAAGMRSDLIRSALEGGRE